MSVSIRDRLKDCGIDLPHTTPPDATYVAVTRSIDTLFVSGQISVAADGEIITGRLGADCPPERGIAAARLAAINVLAQIAAVTDDSVSAVRRIARLGVYIAATPDFTDHSQIANGASDLMVAVFGEAGRHARVALGMSSLPAGAAVKVEAIVELEAGGC